MALLKTSYTFNEFFETIKAKINELNENITNWSESSNAGSFARAMAYFMTYMQLQINTVYMSIGRVSTAIGVHLDRKMEDFGLTRKGDTFATTTIEFLGSANRVSTVTINAGTTIETEQDYFGNTIKYELDSTVYLLTGAVSVTGSATCITIGTAGNISSGTLVNLSTPIIGISGTTNPFDVTNGANLEKDEDFRKRLPSHLLGLKRGNEDSILAAAYSIAGISYADITPNTPNLGTFTLFITTETGVVDNVLKARVLSAVNEVKAFCITPNIVAPSISGVTIEFEAKIDADNYNTLILINYMKQQLSNFVNLRAKNSLYLSEIHREMLKIDGVNYIDNVTINNVEENLELSRLYTIKIEDVSDITITVL